MVRPKEIIEAILYTLKTSDRFPDSVNYVGYTPDINSESIKLPLIEVSPDLMEELSAANTDFVGYKTDDSGARVSKIYDTEYTMTVNVAVWTAQGSKYSPRELSNKVRDALYRHETRGPNEPLQNPDNTLVDDVWHFTIEEGEHTDDLTTSPTLRRWEQQVSISANERYLTTDEPPAASEFDLTV